MGSLGVSVADLDMGGDSEASDSNARNEGNDHNLYVRRPIGAVYRMVHGEPQGVAVLEVEIGRLRRGAEWKRRRQASMFRRRCRLRSTI